MQTVELKVAYADVAGERERLKALEEVKRVPKQQEEDEWDEWGKKPKAVIEERKTTRRRSLQSDSQRLMGLRFEKRAREKLWAKEQKVMAANREREERLARAEARELDQQMATLLDAKSPWKCDVCQKMIPRSKVMARPIDHSAFHYALTTAATGCHGAHP
jgi:RNA polymerase-binding transcription factor DksA